MENLFLIIEIVFFIFILGVFGFYFYLRKQTRTKDSKEE